MPQRQSQPESTPSAPAPLTATPSAKDSPPEGGIGVPPTGGAPGERVSRRAVFAILIMTFGNIGATLMPLMVAAPVIVARIDPENKEASLGIALAISALGTMVLTPLFGAVSDRTTSRFGRRKPGLMISPVFIVLGLVTLGLADSLAAVYAGMACLALGQAMFDASQSALVPDSIPDRARGRVFGFCSVAGVLGGLIAGIVGPQFIDHQFVMTVGAVPFFLLTLVIGLALYRDRRLDPKDVPREPLVRTLTRGYRFSPKSSPDFAWAWFSRFLVTFGVAFASSFVVYFLTDELKVGKDELGSLVSINSVLSMAGTMAGTIAGSFLTDKVRSRKNLVMVSALLLAAGSVVVAFAPSVPVFFAGGAVVYFAVGLFIPTGGVLMMSVLPGGDREVARYMSLLVIADQLPRSIGPVIAPVIISVGAATALGGYPVLYLTASIFAIAGGVLIRRVRGIA